MRVRIAPKIVIRVSAILVLSASLPNALALERGQAGHREHAFVNQETPQNVYDEPLSPRLAALQDRLKSGDRGALDRFWKEIEKKGTPIIEPAPDSDRDVLVTMVWRAREETRNVFVFRLGDVSKPMARLLETDLWYKTFRL